MLEQNNFYVPDALLSLNLYVKAPKNGYVYLKVGFRMIILSLVAVWCCWFVGGDDLTGLCTS